ncbi:d2.2 [Tranosema rostrale ichnovirus]|nr:d2.2 [Tranosema rostrale ichnovirus]
MDESNETINLLKRKNGEKDDVVVKKEAKAVSMTNEKNAGIAQVVKQNEDKLRLALDSILQGGKLDFIISLVYNGRRCGGALSLKKKSVYSTGGRTETLASTRERAHRDVRDHVIGSTIEHIRDYI